MGRGAHPGRGARPARQPRVPHRAGSCPTATAPIVVYCASGSRSAFAAKTLEELGYTNVALARRRLHGVEARRTSRSTCRARSQPEQRARYSRHLLIPEVGEAGQLKLLDSRVLLLGAGGLGSPAALYLAAAGVGTLGIIDPDIVDASNLQRQVIHSTATLGEPKVLSAKKTLEALNPDVEVVPYQERLDSDNVDRILADGWDVIVDGADNFPTRYLVNDASVWHGIPVVHGSIFRFHGQVTVFKPGEGPCYRCLFPQPPPPELAPSCAEGGVLGVLPGHHRLAPGERGAEARCSASATRSSAARCCSRRSRDRSRRSSSARIPSARSAASTRRSPSTSTTSSSARAARTHAAP